MININLVKSVPNKEIRKDVVNVFYGIVPADGVTRSIKTILNKEESRAIRIDPPKSAGKMRITSSQ